ncbi:MAG: DUF177 domain-containing protein [Clostridia bacterium]|nr:DUF177 domain-containing protein [Clostridia bacterium]
MPVSYEMDLRSLDVSGGFPLKKPVVANGTVSNEAGLVLLRLRIDYLFDAPCDRCGVETSQAHSIELERALATSIEGEESDTILTVPDMKLDVDELVSTEVIVDLPTKHLCREDCKGICPKCGKDLNQGDCGCPTREIDPRLSALADLLKQ